MQQKEQSYRSTNNGTQNDSVDKTSRIVSDSAFGSASDISSECKLANTSDTTSDSTLNITSNSELNSTSDSTLNTPDQFSRSRMIYGESGIERLSHARVAVFGLGGVGGNVCEALVRTGLGAIDIIDKDVVDITNLNRQIIATHRTLGMRKIDAMEQRLLSINPSCKITKYDCFFLPETADQFSFSHYDYIVDAVDTVTAKIELIVRAHKAKTPIISAMGAGNKTDPTALQITDIYETSVCRLARIMRKELRKRGIDHLKVCYSSEPSCTPFADKTEPESMAKQSTRPAPGSNAFVPAAMGLALASEVVRDITSYSDRHNQPLQPDHYS